ncbi:MAG: asparagine synthase (glutamine-hydrolyzing) [Myxococcales bacterium]|nr:asparagine synthase (glutamine-hydrolyzing) [Myxococcales bacterium]
MCGIAGVFHYAQPERPVDRELLTRMTRVLHHRGPDDEGFHIDGPIGLGHRRLSIVDPTPTGKQPMGTADGGAWLSYNGELYNHLAFRPRLASKGFTFRGSSDTETLLYLLSQDGPGALTDSLGIFGFAFWDARHKRLILARDPLGVKQVYYHDDGKRIVFASEIKALLECPDVPREADPEAINQYLHFHTPLFDRTFFKNVKQVRAGEYLEVNQHGPRARVYWQLDGFERRTTTPERQVEELRELLGTVVGDQLMSDVPVGSFFSGGVDSSAVAAFAKNRGQRLRCFGVHFTNQGVIDEREYQEKAAAALGLDLELTTLDGSTFPDDLPRLMYFQDQPVIGAALLPMFAVSQLAARKVKVCLGGQAADELFGGYARYALAHPSMVLSSWFKGRKGVSAGVGPSSRVGGNLFKQLADVRNLKRLARAGLSAASWSGRYFENFAKLSESDLSPVFAEGVVSRERAREVFEDTLRRSAATDPADKLMHWDLQTYLTGLFQQDDRMSMANSLESRVPLADPRLVRFAFHTPFGLKVRGGATKWILRQAVAPVIPEEVLNRRKVGFDTPAESWMRTSHRGFVHETLNSARSRSRGFWAGDAVARMVENERHPHWFDLAWKLLAIEVWAQVFLDGKTPALHPSPRRTDAS